MGRRTHQRRHAARVLPTAPAPIAVAEAAGPVVPADRLSLRRAFIALAGGIALWIVASTAWMMIVGFRVLPAGDEWDRWNSYLAQGYTFRWFFDQHVDHRIVVPRVLFAIDHLVFNAREWFLLVCSFGFQAGSAIILWRLAVRNRTQTAGERAFTAAVILSFAFSAQQWINFIWGFQVVFPLVYCAAAASLFALLKYSEQGWRPFRWIAVTLLMAIIATFTMANGILLWAVLLAAAFWLRAPRSKILIILMTALFISVAYFYGWHRAGGGELKLQPLERIWHFVVFALAHLGSPIGPLAGWTNVVYAAVVGAVLLLALIIIGIQLLRHRTERSAAAAMLFFMALFLVASSCAVALGRSDMVPLTEAFTPRYLTLAYLFWITILISVWPWLYGQGGLITYGLICLTLVALVGVHQHTGIQAARRWAAAVHRVEVAVANSVVDLDAWKFLFHSPKSALPAVDYLRAHRLSIFTEEWTHWPGIPLNSRFTIGRSAGACRGAVESIERVASPMGPGWRVSGWAGNANLGRSGGFVIIGDAGGKVAGVALPDLSSIPSAGNQFRWQGYVSDQPRLITAFVLEGDQRSICAIGTRSVPVADATPQ